MDFFFSFFFSTSTLIPTLIVGEAVCLSLVLLLRLMMLGLGELGLLTPRPCLVFAAAVVPEAGERWEDSLLDLVLCIAGEPDVC